MIYSCQSGLHEDRQSNSDGFGIRQLGIGGNHRRGESQSVTNNKADRNQLVFQVVSCCTTEMVDICFTHTGYAPTHAISQRTISTDVTSPAHQAINILTRDIALSVSLSLFLSFSLLFSLYLSLFLPLSLFLYISTSRSLSVYFPHHGKNQLTVHVFAEAESDHQLHPASHRYHIS